MTIEEIMSQRKQLNAELRLAASQMTLNDNVRAVFQKIQALQQICPHQSDKYNYSIEDGICPYCGKKVGDV